MKSLIGCPYMASSEMFTAKRKGRLEVTVDGFPLQQMIRFSQFSFLISKIYSYKL